MVSPEHEAEWPDKAMFSAMILTLAGALGVLFSLLRATNATIGGDSALVGILLDWPIWIMLPATIIATVMGALGVRHQSSLYVYIGNGAGLVSLAGLGLVPVLCIASIAFMIRAHIEGEDTTLATPVPAADEWPDKAMAASMLLFVTGLMTILQAISTYADRFAPVFLPDTPAVWATWALLVGLFCLWSAREIFHLRRAWSGTVAAVVGFLGFGFYVIGPLLCVVALVMLFLADREQEFDFPEADA